MDGNQWDCTSSCCRVAAAPVGLLGEQKKMRSVRLTCGRSPVALPDQLGVPRAMKKPAMAQALFPHDAVSCIASKANDHMILESIYDGR